MGLLSMMDAILGRPLADILAEVPVTADIKAALLTGSSPLHPIYEFIQAYERGDWDEIVRRSKTAAERKHSDGSLPRGRRLGQPNLSGKRGRRQPGCPVSRQPILMNHAG